MRVTVKVNTPKFNREVKRALDQLRDRVDGYNTSSVGVDSKLAQTTHPTNGDLTFGQLSAILEYERPHLRPTANKRKNVWSAVLGKSMLAVVRGKKKLKAAMEQVAELMGKDVRATIDAGVPPSNAPSTVAKKGFNHPLIETGAYRDSIVGEVTKG